MWPIRGKHVHYDPDPMYIYKFDVAFHTDIVFVEAA